MQYQLQSARDAIFFHEQGYKIPISLKAKEEASNIGDGRICILFTFFEILILVKGLDGVIFAQTSKSINEMGTEVGVDILWRKFGRTLSVYGPIGVITHNSPIINLSFHYMVAGI